MLRLCDSVDNKRSNISAALHPNRPKTICVHLGKKVCPNLYFSGKGVQGPKKHSSYLSRLTRYWSKNLKIYLKNWPMAVGQVVEIN